MLLQFVLSQRLIRTNQAFCLSRRHRLPKASFTAIACGIRIYKSVYLTRSESALPKSLTLNSFRIRTYKKWRGRVQIVNLSGAET